MWKDIYIYALIVFSFVSLSLFEVMVVLGLLWIIWDFVKSRSFKINSQLSLSKPVLILQIPSLVSTVFFAPGKILKAVEESVFQLIYFFGIDVRRQLVGNIVTIFLLAGIFLLPVVIYNGIHKGVPEPIWGGVFEVGQFYSEILIITFLIFVFVLNNVNSNKNFALTRMIINHKVLLLSLLVLMIFFLIILLATHRRSSLLGFLIVLYLIIFLMYKSRFIKKITFFGFNLLILIFLIVAYSYLSFTDSRFRLLNEIVTGKKELNQTNINLISSKRLFIGIDGINIIKNDLKEKNFVHILIGHGIRSGTYLPKKYTHPKSEKFESIIFISEFIEKGLIGLLAILAIFYYAFKTFLSVRISESFDLLALGLFVPLLIHLIGSIFTFFWDALLPLYLLLFKIGEIYFVQKKNVLI